MCQISDKFQADIFPLSVVDQEISHRLVAELQENIVGRFYFALEISPKKMGALIG